MCTLTIYKNADRLIITSNRDEDPRRNAFNRFRNVINSQGWGMFPIDPDSDGTWIGISENGSFYCLLNGGLVKHKRKLPYKKSRGTLIPTLLNDPHFLNSPEINFNDYEPFTLVSVKKLFIEVHIWTGEEVIRQLKTLDEVHMWSSTTLYTEKEHQEKKRLFENKLKSSLLNEDAIFQLHAHDLKYEHSCHQPNGIVKTIQVMQLILNNQPEQLKSLDVITNSLREYDLTKA